MISIINVRKRFRRLYALDDVSATFDPAQVIALIGPNGSGKTTLIKSILGLVQPDDGDVLFRGESIKKGGDYRRFIGYMPQIGRYPENMRVGQVLNMVGKVRGEAMTDRDLYEAFNIDAIKNKTMQSLSGGTRQKVSATLAFMFDAPVLILDEPTAGLDPVSSEILKQKIAHERAKGKLILITSHILSDLEDMIDNVMYLQEGKLQFHDSFVALQETTGETRLGRAIAVLQRSQFNFKLQASII